MKYIVKCIAKHYWKSCQTIVEDRFEGYKWARERGFEWQQIEYGFDTAGNEVYYIFCREEKRNGFDRCYC